MKDGWTAAYAILILACMLVAAVLVKEVEPLSVVCTNPVEDREEEVNAEN